MRLLEWGHKKVSLHSFGDHEIPPYAILSHTWGDDEDEVTFKDVMEGSGKGRREYRKIEFCAKQAATDGLRYFWVDTCCINKEISSELTEAITSMFRWYQKAAKCYVYLPDVHSDNAQKPWESAMRKSRWFTRGWTLQELIAPRQVEFYSLEGKCLGDRRSMESLIQEITRIPVDVLRGEALSKFSDEEKFRWARDRQTKRPEDKVYSLLGIFGVSLIMNYGEGIQEAHLRLEDAI
ncbi:HET-domain-containing protein, partial [Aulographum hederae CBS 113979]